MKTCIRFPRNPIPKLCWGCGEPFPLRDGRIEAQLGQDGRLYCYASTRSPSFPPRSRPNWPPVRGRPIFRAGLRRIKLSFVAAGTRASRQSDSIGFFQAQFRVTRP
jgi:hypothetical protein